MVEDNQEKENTEAKLLDGMAETIFNSKILDLILNEKQRLAQLIMAMDERTIFLQGMDPQFQYLRGTQKEIENQIAQLETLTANLNEAKK